MINEFLNLLKNYNQDELDRMALDNYVMSPGFYFIISKDGKNITGPYEVTNNSFPENYEWLKERDFYSCVINQKELVNNHKIRTNNYLSFGFRTDGKDVSEKDFEEASKKLISLNTDKNALLIHKYLSVNPINEENVMKYMNIFKSFHNYVVDEVKKYSDKKEILIKLFIDEDIEEYKKEGMRYLSTKIFGENNKHNIIIDNKLYGASAFNISFNKDKKYLFPNEPKFKNPFIISIEDALRLNRFIDIIIGLNNQRKEDKQSNDSYIYLPYSYDFKGLASQDCDGYKIIASKGKIGIDIKDFEFATGGKISKHKNFQIRNIIGFKEEENQEKADAQNFLFEQIDKYLFDNQLSKNIYRSTDNMFFPNSTDFMVENYVRTYSKLIQGYFWKDEDISPFIDKLFILIKYLCTKSNNFKSMKIYNLYLNILENIGGKKMNVIKQVEDLNIKAQNMFNFDNDFEFMFGLGQLTNYILSKSNTNNKTQNMYSPFLSCKKVNILSSKLTNSQMRYGYAIPKTTKYHNMQAAIHSYQVINNDITDDMMNAYMAGLYSQNIFYIKNNSEVEDNE